MRFFLPVLVLAATGCGTLSYADVQEPSICIPLVGVYFEAISSTSPFRQEFEFPLGEKIPLVGLSSVETTIRLTEILFTVGSGESDFASWESVTVRVLPPYDSSLLSRDLLFYERDPAHLPEATLLLTGKNGPNLKPYFRNDNVRFEFEVTGTSSARSVLSLTGCFYTKARID